MADRKITELTALAAGSQATGDLLAIVDVSETASADKNKKITVENLLKGIPSNVGIATTSPSAPLAFGKSDYGEPSSEDFYRIKFKDNGGTENDVGIGMPNASSLGFNSVSNGSIRFYTGTDGESMRIDSSGRLLVGTTSNSSNAAVQGFKAHGSTGNESGFTSIDTTAMAAGVGGEISFMGNTTSAGEYNYLGHIRGIKENATSGNTACALTFHTRPTATAPQERMRIDSSGNVGIGTSNPAAGASGGADRILNIASGSSGGTSHITFGDGSAVGVIESVNGNGVIGINGAHNVTIGTGGSSTERLRVDSSGRLLVGTSSSVAFNGIPSAFQIQGSTNTTTRMSIRRTANDTSAGVLVFGKSRSSAHAVLSNNDEIGKIEFYGADGTDTNQRAAMIIGAVDGTPGSNDMPGRLVFATTADGSATPSERWRMTKDGTFTSKTSDIGSVTGVGITLEEDGAGIFARSGANPVFINRITNDGNLIQFYGNNTLEGNIAVNGTTVSYNGAHLSRWSQLASGAERVEILRGSVLSNLDEMCEWGEEDNEQLNRMKVSDVEGDVNVAGVFQGWDDEDDTYTNDFYCAMTGDFVIRIAQGTTVARGDLLMSAGDGTAKPQDDDIVRSKTIAKVTSTTISTTYADGSYCVPCVLMAC